ncbi:MAG: histidinol dehydrogenase [Anaerolineales bacterium]
MMVRIFTSSEARSTLLHRRRGAASYPKSLLASLEASFGEGSTPETVVRMILASVRAEGDDALRRWTKELDNVAIDEFQVPIEVLRAAERGLSDDLRRALKFAIDRVRDFHQRQPVPSWSAETEDGEMGQRHSPVDSVGVYVPGGSAPLISSLYMSVIPAQVAGVEKIIVCSPPPIDQSVLAVASMLGVEEIYSIGGAQAVGAMAYGTQTVPAVDMVVGAGNIFVTLAKKEVFGRVGIDGLAGPTETMILADEGANADWIAADMLAQAEHDPLASAILITDSQVLASRVQQAVVDQIQALSRREIVEQSLKEKGGIVIVNDLFQALEMANEYAPEHLCIVAANDDELFSRVRNAGCVFIGENSFEVLGDYVAGPSHVLPTGGSARFAAPLNVLSFLNMTSYLRVQRQASAQLSAFASEIARNEKLDAHAQAAKLRVQEINDAS